MVEVSYELYTQVKGRWNLEARYANAEREDALNDAKNLSHDGHIDAVRLVRETYDPDRGASREATIYSTVKRGGGGKSSGDDDYGGGGYDDDEGYDDYDEYDDFEDEGYGGYGGYAGDYDDDEDEDEGGSRQRKRAGGGRFAMHTVILIKVLVILLISFGFAVLMTFIYSQFVMSGG